MELVAMPRIEKTAMQRHSQGTKAMGAACAVLLVVSCATTPPPSLMSIPPLVNQPAYEAEDIAFLTISDPMKQFVRRAAPTALSVGRRAWSLSYSVLDPFILPFEYDANLTVSAQDAFRRQSGNCLSFSAMFIAMAREAGLKAWFQEVKVPPQWTNIDDTFLVSMHVNAVVESRGSHYVVDVSGTRRSDWLDADRISDEQALGQFYNNLGAEALVRQDLPQAYAYLRKALEADPRGSYIWSNLAVVLNRNGQRDDAIASYRTALAINPQESTALNNLQQLYVDAGDYAKANEMLSRVEKYRNQNPWYMYVLSQEALEENRYTDAVNHLEDAIRLNQKEYRFHYALARVLMLQGDQQAAQDSLERARRLAPPESEISQAGLSQLMLNGER